MRAKKNITTFFSFALSRLQQPGSPQQLTARGARQQKAQPERNARVRALPRYEGAFMSASTIYLFSARTLVFRGSVFLPFSMLPPIH